MSKYANLINNSAIFRRAKVIRLKRTHRAFCWPLVQSNSVVKWYLETYSLSARKYAFISAHVF